MIPVGLVWVLVTPVPTEKEAPTSTVVFPPTDNCNLLAVASLTIKVPAFTCRSPFSVRFVVRATSDEVALIERLL